MRPARKPSALDNIPARGIGRIVSINRKMLKKEERDSK
jgi:hypothetical protein